MLVVLLLLFSSFFSLETVGLDEKGHPIDTEIPKPSNLAGRWYSSSKTELTNTIEKFLKKNPRLESRVGLTRALILPHAGFTYSGNTIAKSLNVEDLKRFKRFWIFAPSHHQMFNGFSIPFDYSHYSTPLGNVRITKSIVDVLRKDRHFIHAKKGHKAEHSIEIELPFLQVLLKDEEFEIIPILLGRLDKSSLTSLSGLILEFYDPETDLLLVSSDFTHFGPNYNFEPFHSDRKENLEKMDMESYEMIQNYDIDGFLSHHKQCVQTVCGKTPIALLLSILENQKEELWTTLDKYETSGQLTGDYTNSVSYLGITFHDKKRRDDLIKAEPDDPYTNEEKTFILSTVRNVVTDFLNSQDESNLKYPALPNIEMQQKFDKVQGCFVTYKKNGELRGCIGHVYPHAKLYDCILQNTISAAVKDHRFQPMTFEELMSSDIHIEVSILTDPTEIRFSSTGELLDQIREGIDGVILRKGRHQSTYLPIVWDQISDKKNFLSHLCRKAGLPHNCWMNDPKDLIVHVYQSIVFEE